MILPTFRTFIQHYSKDIREVASKRKKKWLLIGNCDIKPRLSANRLQI